MLLQLLHLLLLLRVQLLQVLNLRLVLLLHHLDLLQLRLARLLLLLPVAPHQHEDDDARHEHHHHDHDEHRQTTARLPPLAHALLARARLAVLVRAARLSTLALRAAHAATVHVRLARAQHAVVAREHILLPRALREHARRANRADGEPALLQQLLQRRQRTRVVEEALHFALRTTRRIHHQRRVQ